MPFSFTQILYRACSAMMGRAVTCRRNLPDLVNLPREDRGAVSHWRSACVCVCRRRVHTEAGSKREELIAGDRGGQVGDGQAHVEDAIADEAEDVAVGVGGIVERRDEVLERAAGVVCQLLEESLGLLFREGPHGVCRWMCLRGGGDNWRC